MELQPAQDTETGFGSASGAGAGPEARPTQDPRREGEEALVSTSASSSNSDLPAALAEGERPAITRRHSGKAFTGLRLFGRR